MGNLAAQYIKDAIEMICIDEYQDTQDLQYAIIEIFRMLIRKNIFKSIFLAIRIRLFMEPWVVLQKL